MSQQSDLVQAEFKVPFLSFVLGSAKGFKPNPRKTKTTTYVVVWLNHFWCTIADVKITFPDDPEADVKEIRELLNGATATMD